MASSYKKKTLSSQKSLFDDVYLEKLERIKSFYLKPISRLSPTLERSFQKVLDDFEHGRPANACVLELAQMERIPYALAGFMMLGRAFPPRDSRG